MSCSVYGLTTVSGNLIWKKALEPAQFTYSAEDPNTHDAHFDLDLTHCFRSESMVLHTSSWLAAVPSWC